QRRGSLRQIVGIVSPRRGLREDRITPDKRAMARLLEKARFGNGSNLAPLNSHFETRPPCEHISPASIGVVLYAQHLPALKPAEVPGVWRSHAVQQGEARHSGQPVSARL